LTFNGAPINPAATYRVAATDYLIGGGDGYGAYLPSTGLLATHTGIVSPVAEYIYDQDAPLVPATDGRVTLIGGVVH
jgi:2',3'-cyclic-nucleotide 2'-phosphodiesterase (5'-nucleotidase family)